MTCAVSIGIQVRNHKKEFQGQAQLPFGMLVRVLIFTVIGFVGIGISLVFVTRVFSPLPNLFIALCSCFFCHSPQSMELIVVQCLSQPSSSLVRRRTLSMSGSVGAQNMWRSRLSTRVLAPPRFEDGQ
jgi:hypothetical protein